MNILKADRCSKTNTWRGFVVSQKKRRQRSAVARRLHTLRRHSRKSRAQLQDRQVRMRDRKALITRSRMCRRHGSSSYRSAASDRHIARSVGGRRRSGALLRFLFCDNRVPCTAGQNSSHWQFLRGERGNFGCFINWPHTFHTLKCKEATDINDIIYHVSQKMSDTIYNLKQLEPILETVGT